MHFAIIPHSGDRYLALPARLHEALGFEDHWLRLTPLQRAVAAALAEGAEKPFAEATVKDIGRRIGDKTLSTGRVQTALKKLARECLASSIAGGWRL